MSSDRAEGTFQRSADEAAALPQAAFAGLLGDVLSRDRSLRFTARGASMYPFIRSGDVVTVSPAGNRTLGLGDVVAFRSSGGAEVAVHRIHRREGTGYLLQGDNCNGPDGAVRASDVLGVVTVVERAGRPVRLGLGPERRLLALLGRLGLLGAAVRGAGTLVRLARGR